MFIVGVILKPTNLSDSILYFNAGTYHEMPGHNYPIDLFTTNYQCRKFALQCLSDTFLGIAQREDGHLHCDENVSSEEKTRAVIN